MCRAFRSSDTAKGLATCPASCADGPTEPEAKLAVLVLALRVAADRLEHGEAVPAAILDAFQSAA